MKCPKCGYNIRKKKWVLDDKDVMLFVSGSKRSFRCECGCNVFRKVIENPIDDKYTYQCNGCCMLYEGEK